MPTRHLLPLLVVMAVCCVAADAPTKTFRSPAARRAQLEHDRELKAAKATYDRAVSQAMNKYRLALTKAKDLATKQGDLDEALAIRNKIAQLEVGPASPVKPKKPAGLYAARQALTERLHGTVWDFPPGPVTFHPDGAWSHPNGKGIWTVLDHKQVMFRWQDRGGNGFQLLVLEEGGRTFSLRMIGRPHKVSHVAKRIR